MHILIKVNKARFWMHCMLKWSCSFNEKTTCQYKQFFLLVKYDFPFTVDLLAIIITNSLQWLVNKLAYVVGLCCFESAATTRLPEPPHSVENGWCAKRRTAVWAPEYEIRNFAENFMLAISVFNQTLRTTEEHLFIEVHIRNDLE